jgi:ATP-dependent protease ClpP protease subunit
MNEFFRFRAEAGDEPNSAELLIFSQIGSWDDMGDVSARIFAAELGKLPTSVKRLDIHINSPGGSVFEAQGIYSRLADHRSQKVVYVDGLAASAASIIAMVGHKIYIRANANMMIHLPSGLVMGNAEDMRHVATALDSITESMINVYAKRTNLEREEIRALLQAETWFWPEQAVEKGFADEVRGVVKAAALVGENRAVFNGVEFDLSRFTNVPAFTATTNHERKTMKPKPKANADAGTPAADPPENPDPNPNPQPPPNPPPNDPPPPNSAPAGQPNQPAAAQSDYDKGVEAERARVTALQKLDRPATHEIVTAAIKDGKQASDIMEECMTAMDKAAKQGARHADASQLNGIPPSDGADEQKKFGGKLKDAVAARRNKRNRNVRVNSRN